VTGAADVLIVGAGAAGGVLAGRLVRAGLRVRCLEQGDWHDPAAFGSGDPAFELVARRRWSPDPSARRGAADYPVDASESDLAPLMFSGVGGSTLLYAADWCRMRPSDFRVRTLDGVGDDWPLSYADLAPHFDATDREFGVAGLAGDPSLPPDVAPPPYGPLPLGPGALRVAAAHDRLGWHWWPGTNAVHPGACVQWGTCIEGCPVGAKATADLTHWRAAVAAGVRLDVGARAQRVGLDRRGRARGVEYVDGEGRSQLARAGVVVLAANGLGTPRLLLLSACAGHDDGLANSSGLVGRRLMMHPFATVSGVFDEPLRTWVGHAGPKIVSYEFYESDGSRGFVRGAKWSLGGVAGPVGIALAHPDDAPPPWGAGHLAGMRERVGRTMSWGIFTDDLPEDDNRVALDAAHCDGDGLPGVRVRYRIGENTRRMLAFHAARAEESLEAAGARQVHTQVPVRSAGWHLLGTARMGRDPATSVVDRFGRCHDVPNLYVADGSAFVTAAGVNPTSTVAALAARLAEHLVATRREVAVAA
jgi:choline dehydrogenase-like flavoprotein